MAANCCDTGAFRVSLFNDDPIPAGNGFGGNGGWSPHLDTTVFDTKAGVVLSLDYSTLPSIVAAIAFYAPSTAYIVPVGMAGIWAFSWQAFMSDNAPDQLYNFSAGFTHLRASGQFVDTDDPSGSQIQSAYRINLNPAGLPLSNGYSVLAPVVLYQVLEGDIIIPFIQRQATTGNIRIASFSTWFEGWRVSTDPGIIAGNAIVAESGVKLITE